MSSHLIAAYVIFCVTPLGLALSIRLRFRKVKQLSRLRRLHPWR